MQKRLSSILIGKFSSRPVSQTAGMNHTAECRRQPSPGRYLVRSGSVYLFQIKVSKEIGYWQIGGLIRISLGSRPHREARRLADRASGNCESCESPVFDLFTDAAQATRKLGKVSRRRSRPMRRRSISHVAHSLTRLSFPSWHPYPDSSSGRQWLKRELKGPGQAWLKLRSGIWRRKKLRLMSCASEAIVALTAMSVA